MRTGRRQIQGVGDVSVLDMGMVMRMIEGSENTRKI